jgi:predicted metal-dependent phosphoesterase TrpH
MVLLKTVFHVHTDYSPDTNTPVDALVAEARSRGVDCLTITDHDTIEGARAVAARAGPDLQVIVGEEISTADGHLIGLFLREHIEPGQSPRKTAELIHRQGGIVVIPHPFNRLFDCSLREKVHEVIDLADVVEVSNAQNFMSSPNRQARGLAVRFGLPMLVGVDVHHPGYLDSCYQWLPPFKGPREFLAAVRQAKLVEGRHPWSYFAKTAWYTLFEKTGLNVPEGYGRNCPLRNGGAAAVGENA